MKKPDITAGEWTYQATAGNHDFAIYPEETGRDIALVRDFHQANAQAIAALPKLLEALENCLPYAAMLNSSMFDSDKQRKAYTQARSALIAAGYTE